MTLNVKVITFIPLVCINIRTTFGTLCRTLSTKHSYNFADTHFGTEHFVEHFTKHSFVEHFTEHFMEHFAEHFMEHFEQNTFCRTLHRTFCDTFCRTFSDTFYRTFCGTLCRTLCETLCRTLCRTFHGTLCRTFHRTFQGTSFAACFEVQVLWHKFLRYILWNILRYKFWGTSFKIEYSYLYNTLSPNDTKCKSHHFYTFSVYQY